MVQSFIFLLIAKLAFKYQWLEVKLTEKPEKEVMSEVHIYFENLEVQVYNIFVFNIQIIFIN